MNSSTQLNNLNSYLKLTNYVLPVHLGVTPEEQKQSQDVVIDIIIKYSTFPKGCDTDIITDTICYQKLTDAIKNFCMDKKFSLIEHLIKQLFVFVKAQLSDQKLSLSVTKNPPIANLGSSSFTISDWEG